MNRYFTFSEAIRDGAKLRPQGFGTLFNKGNSCGLGAGYEAITGKPEGSSEVLDLVMLQFPYLGNPSPECPTVGCREYQADEWKELVDVIPHLNDYHSWTREAIADWLEKEEQKLGFVIIDTEAPKPEMVAEYQPLKITVPSLP